MTTLGDRLKIARERKGFTQIQVKNYTNINNKTLSGYEKGVSEPDIKTLVTLAELYEVSYKWLLSGEGSIDDTNDQTSPLEDPELEGFIQNVRRWYKEAPKDREEDLQRLKRIFEAYKND
mgnify:FL=1